MNNLTIELSQSRMIISVITYKIINSYEISFSSLEPDLTETQSKFWTI